MGSMRIKDSTDNLINTSYQAPISPLSPSVSTGTEQGTPPASTTTVKAPTVNLFDQNTYQTQSSVALPDGSTINLPMPTQEDATTFKSLFANVPDDQKDALNAASANIATAVMAYVQANPVSNASSASAPASSGSAAVIANNASSANTSSVGGANTVSKLAVGGVSKAGETITGPSTQASAPVLGGDPSTYTISQASPDVAAVNSAVASAATTYKTATGDGGYDSTVQAVAYMGVQGLQQSLGAYATQMQGQLDNQNTVRTDQTELTNAVADWPPNTTTQSFTYHDVDANGNLQTYTADLTQTQAKSEADNLSNTLSTMGSDTQMMQTRLQTMEQNYQQGVTTISNIMKMQYDMVKNTIGNIHY